MTISSRVGNSSSSFSIFRVFAEKEVKWVFRGTGSAQRQAVGTKGTTGLTPNLGALTKIIILTNLENVSAR